jgi:hypothetical protein
MRELSQLKMSRRRKFGIMLMFLGGGLYVQFPPYFTLSVC